MLNASLQMGPPLMLAAALPVGAFVGIACLCTALTVACHSLQKNIFSSLCKDLKRACATVDTDENGIANVAYEFGLLKGLSWVMLLCCVVIWYSTLLVSLADDGSRSPADLALYAGPLTVVMFAVWLVSLVWHVRHRYSSL